MESINTKSGNGRLVGIDLARAVAIVGMMLIHFNENIGSAPFSGPDWLVWLARLLPGRAAVTFVMLAGIGMSMAARRARDTGDLVLRQEIRKNLLRRAAVLFVFGLLFHVVWDGEILHCYGIFITIGTLLLFAPASLLWSLIVVLNIGSIAMLLGLNGNARWEYDVGWDWANLTRTDFWTPIGFVRGLVFNGWFPIFPWLGFLLAGIWMGRLNLRSRTARLHCMLWGGAVALGADAASWVMVNHIGPRLFDMPYELAYAAFGRECLPPSPFFAVQTGAGAIFLIALCLETVDRFGDSRWVRPWIIFGQYALSVYIGHVILFILPILLIGFTDRSLSVAVPIGIAGVLVSLALCLVWNRNHPRGPLETLIRRLVGGKP